MCVYIWNWDKKEHKLRNYDYMIKRLNVDPFYGF